MVGATRRGFRIHRSASLTRPSCGPKPRRQSRDEGSSSPQPVSSAARASAPSSAAHLREGSRSFTRRRPENGRIEHMLLAGLPVPDRLVLELAQCRRTEGLNDTAEILEDAYDDERGVVVLTIPDREA